MNRRDFLQLSAAAPLLVAATPSPSVPEPSVYGALGAPGELDVMLPPGFRVRAVGTAGVRVAGTRHEWHTKPDGGATFPVSGGGWIYVSNSEVGDPNGGVGAIRFAPDGTIADAYEILRGTDRNCAGGATPWGTWLSCEEVPGGLVYECDPLGRRDAVERPAMGEFRHEAVAADPVGRALYMTEDEPTGRLYRFTPREWEDLSDGVLEVAQEADDGTVAWAPADEDGTIYSGGEGIAYRDGRIVFTNKGDGAIRELHLATAKMRVLHRRGDIPPIAGPDNITFSEAGDLYVCEEEPTEQDVVMIAPDGTTASVLRLGPSHTDSELTGVAFDPSGTRMYVSSQRGAGGDGVTFEVTGPFRRSTSRAPAAQEGSGDSFPIVPIVGAAGGALAVLGGVAWWRSRAGSAEE